MDEHFLSSFFGEGVVILLTRIDEHFLSSFFGEGVVIILTRISDVLHILNILDALEYCYLDRPCTVVTGGLIKCS